MGALVVAATKAEARYVPDGLALVVTGPGKAAAAAATATALARLPDPASTLVVNVGTAGGLRDDVSGVLLPSTVVNHDFSAEAIRSMGIEAVDRLGLAGGDDLVLATGDSFIESAAERARLAALASLVDMEGFAVAYAASLFDARTLCVKHVSDAADDTARVDWPAAVDASARALGDWLRANL